MLQEAIGGCPSVYALYRFTRKLRTHKPLLDACIDRVTTALREELPGYGQHLAVDASDLPAFANGQRYLKKNGPERERFSDPDASWGHRSAIIHTASSDGFYGYKLHAWPSCAQHRSSQSRGTSPPPGRTSQAKSGGSSTQSSPATSNQRRSPFDKGYDFEAVYDACHQSGVSAGHPAPRDPSRQARQTPSANMRARRLDVRRNRTSDTSERSGAAPRGDCQPKNVFGGKRPGCIRSSPAKRSAGGTSTGAAPPSSANSADSQRPPAARSCHLSRPRASGRPHPDPSPAGASRPLDLRPQGDLAETGVLGVAI